MQQVTFKDLGERDKKKLQVILTSYAQAQKEIKELKEQIEYLQLQSVKQTQDYKKQNQTLKSQVKELEKQNKSLNTSALQLQSSINLESSNLQQNSKTTQTNSYEIRQRLGSEQRRNEAGAQTDDNISQKNGLQNKSTETENQIQVQEIQSKVQTVEEVQVQPQSNNAKLNDPQMYAQNLHQIQQQLNLAFQQKQVGNVNQFKQNNANQKNENSIISLAEDPRGIHSPSSVYQPIDSIREMVFGKHMDILDAIQNTLPKFPFETKGNQLEIQKKELPIKQELEQETKKQQDIHVYDDQLNIKQAQNDEIINQNADQFKIERNSKSDDEGLNENIQENKQIDKIDFIRTHKQQSLPETVLVKQYIKQEPLEESLVKSVKVIQIKRKKVDIRQQTPQPLEARPVQQKEEVDPIEQVIPSTPKKAEISELPKPESDQLRQISQTNLSQSIQKSPLTTSRLLTNARALESRSITRDPDSEKLEEDYEKMVYSRDIRTSGGRLNDGQRANANEKIRLDNMRRSIQQIDQAELDSVLDFLNSGGV